ncbi:hypothetical protein ABXT08_17130 [Chryseobacterium sp. NRRL B-14859]|uniref:hypothetical protein n=1 Tax=unclassified Chryseobacterium TaxID=2593645 RepID=UPI000F4543B8|nr:hypothetical protein [Chryseobacterium sp. G0240]ROI05582.1 hypothetical protein EGI16_04125 [Chryseobacterium sp. G0240]
MNSELRELFEIKEDEEKPNKPVSQNVGAHVVIRLAVIVLATIAFFFAMSQAQGWGALGIALYMVMFHALWLLFIIIETVVLQSNGKLKLRNVNLIFIGVLLFIYGIGAIMIFGR